MADYLPFLFPDRDTFQPCQFACLSGIQTATPSILGEVEQEDKGSGLENHILL